jgi:ribulose-5-phosphate 4-epimerase/fuculose-1-phosphate aldolase
MTLKTGILPMCLEAVQIWPKISPTIHQFEGVSTDEAAKPRLCSRLGDKTILQMANHGVGVGSETIQGAFWDMYLIQMACIMQVELDNACPHSSYTLTDTPRDTYSLG